MGRKTFNLGRLWREGKWVTHRSSEIISGAELGPKATLEKVYLYITKKGRYEEEGT